jgi:hypothetical protein
LPLTIAGLTARLRIVKGIEAAVIAAGSIDIVGKGVLR